jgi:hypothetical protein
MYLLIPFQKKGYKYREDTLFKNSGTEGLKGRFLQQKSSYRLVLIFVPRYYGAFYGTMFLFFFSFLVLS